MSMGVTMSYLWSRIPIFIGDTDSFGYVCIHIGVGSNVVCSTSIGNARASVRGTDDSKFPRFFMFVKVIILISAELGTFSLIMN